ncbi:MAG: hypothetical protein K8F91_09205, partial [Candidatus Obscuribacterales bacterium]|nr:hypothetical protein [Candidatus Obscuribacterales bacterium]
MTGHDDTRSYERDIGRGAAVISVIFAIAGLSVNTGLFDFLPAEWIEHGISPASFVVVILLSISTFIQAHNFRSEENANQKNIAALLLSLLATVLAGLLLAHDCSEKIVDCDLLSNQVARFAADKTTDLPMALCLVFVCLTANLSQAWGKRATGIGQYLLLPVFVLVVLSLTATVYGLRDLMMFGMSVAPSPIEAIVLIYVMVALVAARPGEGLAAVLTDKTAAGFVLRVLLPQGLLWPIVLGYLRLLGQTQDWCNSELGASLMTVTTMVFLISASVWAAGKISALDLERRDSESEMSRLNDNLREQIRQMTQLNKEQELVTLEAAKAHDLAIEASMQKAQFLSNMSH